MTSRYEITDKLYKNSYSSKFSFLKLKFKLKMLKIIAGLFKPSSVLPEHSIILNNLTSSPVQFLFQSHGNRGRKTVALFTRLVTKTIWLALDKILHELIPHMLEISTPKAFKTTLLTNNYSWRFRHRLTAVEDFDEIIETKMYTSFKGIYMPFTVHFILSCRVKHFLFEIYLRMLNVPLIFYKRISRQAFDDKEVFIGLKRMYTDVVRSTPSTMFRLVKMRKRAQKIKNKQLRTERQEKRLKQSIANVA